MKAEIRMRRAIGSHGSVHGLDRLQQRHVAAQTLPALFCEDSDCRAPLRFVPAPAPAKAGPAGSTSPGALLLARDARHAATCRYNAPAQRAAVLARLAADPATAQAEDGGGRELNLLALHQALKRGDGPALEPALQPLMDLLVLHALCGPDSTLAQDVVLRLGKKKLAWDAFFHETAHYDRAWARLDTASAEVPMALVGTVRSHRAPAGGAGFSTTFLNCAPKYQQTGVMDRREFYEVSVGHDDAAWLKGLAVGTEIVMVGLWRQGNSHTATRPHPTDPRRTITNVTHKLALRPVSRLQLAVL